MVSSIQALQIPPPPPLRIQAMSVPLSTPHSIRPSLRMPISLPVMLSVRSSLHGGGQSSPRRKLSVRSSLRADDQRQSLPPEPAWIQFFRQARSLEQSTENYDKCKDVFLLYQSPRLPPLRYRVALYLLAFVGELGMDYYKELIGLVGDDDAYEQVEDLEEDEDDMLKTLLKNWKEELLSEKIAYFIIPAVIDAVFHHYFGG